MDSSVSKGVFSPVCAFLTVTVISYLVWRWFNRPHCVDIHNKHVLITGGSSGIGLALAREAVKRGAYVTIVARSTTRLNEAKQELSRFTEDASKISTLSMDLCRPFEEIKECLESHVDVVDVLIHCAGFAVAKTFLSTPVEAFDEQMGVSYLGPVHVTKVLLPRMLKPSADASVQPKDRRIAFFSSIGGQISIYGYSGYAASKFAVRGFAAVLRQELEPTGLLVTTVYPPDTDTPGFANENKEKPRVTEMISGPAGLWSPDALATQVMHDILIGRPESVHGIVGLAVLLATSGVSLPHESMLGPVLAGILELLIAQPLRFLAMLFAFWMRWVIMRYAPPHDTQTGQPEENRGPDM
ncbi:hypothetical protein AAHC03_09752 [Spirometra sp. Aus1]